MTVFKVQVYYSLKHHSHFLFEQNILVFAYFIFCTFKIFIELAQWVAKLKILTTK